MKSPIKKRQPTVMVRQQIYEKIRKKAEEKKVTLVDYVNEMLLLNVEKDDFLKEYAPYLNKIAIDEDTVILRDEKIKKIVEIVYKNDKFSCSVDEKNDCIHIHFVLALPEITKLRSTGKI